MHLSNVNGLLVSCVLQYHLLKVEEGTFVMDTLAKLNLGLPCVRGISLLAVIALQILNGEFYLEGLLEHRI